MKTVIEIALAEYGTKEIVGKLNNQTIVNYAKETGATWVNDDETPWCAIFMNWVFMKARFSLSREVNARSWLKKGKETEDPKTGDIVIFKRGNSTWQGHVGLFISFEGLYVNVLGGNQSNQVKISRYKKSDVLGYRRFNVII